MIKKILGAVILIISVGIGLVNMLSRVSHMDWGHHFNFENELGIDIDSLEISIGDVKTLIQVNDDGLRILEGNINVPENGYPHQVTFKIFNTKKTINLSADSFNCFNCDGNHVFKLKPLGAVYRFIN